MTFGAVAPNKVPLCTSRWISAGQAPIMSWWCWNNSSSISVLATRRARVQEKDDEGLCFGIQRIFSEGTSQMTTEGVLYKEASCKM